MKVILAENSGFCFGVKKAIDTAFNEVEAKNEHKLYTLGPLIHNPQVVEELKQKGIDVIEDLEEVHSGNVIIRSHGVPEKIYREAEEKGIILTDSTCPFVSRIQKIVKEYYDKGYQIAIIGDPNHPEVIGINGWCNDDGVILQKTENIEKLKEDKPTCVVVQTTMSLVLYEEFIELIKHKISDLQIFNTICLATRKRQDAARKLSKEVDAMIVIGGYHSSNTQKLVTICKEEKPNDTFHIETVDEIDFEILKKYETIGITAGASTPHKVVNEVLEKIKNLL
ncbi:4-hydroxy-3-methylbut-2-enyl diphosphate reductase [Alkaliphilus hydrothermalis]|uniref:4-hydroxy-3-methylbut-2-enyl diphosphate reductase n=1 Tax=Alkaliphilus hydrothermalis TaxID=1482730 RepID=A0ABS2NMD9_9FIRM|nr:4-hydroxy-3-methylbut-2-enyl diphosphate reductase [Alkaliphilus hydrothermalis]MBM7614098.1 4-hydroxy-3-methylbut-2-enyl diphosphate reductase [Alkaliphilus hydrothermalis]